MALKSVSTSELRRELARREKGASRLQVIRDRLAKQLAGIESELSGFGLLPSSSGARRGPPAGSGRGGRRAHNKESLPEVIAKVVRVGSTVAPADVSTRVRAAGYKSTATHFGMMVSNALSKDSRFKRVSRGQYERVK